MLRIPSGTQRLRTIILILATFLPSGDAWGANSVGPSPPGPAVAAMIVPLNTDAVQFVAVISAAVELRFDPPGLDLAVRTMAPSEKAPPTNESLIRDVRPTGVAAVLICRFAVVGQEMTVALEWADIEKDARLSVAERKARIDLSLDAFILQSLDVLAAQVQDRIDELAAARRAAVAAAAAPNAATSPPSADGTLGPAATPVETARPTLEVADDTASRRFLLSTGIAPFIPVGAASSYFSLGYMSAVMGDFLFPFPWGSIGLGVSLGVLSFTAEGATGATPSFLLPLGIDARFLLKGASVVGFLFHLSGGAAALIVSGPILGTRAKMVPYARGAVGLDLLFSKTVGVVLDAGYDVYFEMPLLIMGISPALEISLRF